MLLNANEPTQGAADLADDDEATLSASTRSAKLPLKVFDPSTVPAKPPPELLRYRHRPGFFSSLRELWNRREITYTLAERDIRANYKDAALGILWALLTPVLTVAVLSVVFSRVHVFNSGTHIPYPVYAYSGLICWYFFANCVSGGSSAVLGNKGLLGKVHFPRECFPISTIAQASVTTALSIIPFAGLMAIHHIAPKIEVLWSPLFMIIELAFALGVALGLSSIVVHVRDVNQVVPLITQLGLFATPVIWPFSRISPKIQPYYSFFNPVGPIIDNVRRTMLLGLSPDWKLIGLAGAGSLVYLVGGYKLFKRLEGDFADIS